MLSYYFHREMGAETRAVVETGTGIIGRLDKAHAQSYLMYEWNVLSTDVVEVESCPAKSAIYITSVCDNKGCQRCGTAHQVADTKLAFIYCLCNGAERPRVDREYEPT